MIVKYTGTSDFQGFDSKDFDKAGVDGKKVLFAQGEPKEVSDEVGQALIAKDGIFGDFSFEEVKDSDDAEADGSDSQDAPKGEALTESSTPQIGTDATRGTTAAKKATSARTR
jgi:hypothetical protein